MTSAPAFPFASDNIMGAAPRVMEAIVAANAGPAVAYGGDGWTARLKGSMSDLFEREVEIALVATGTAANALALACCTPPWGAVLTHAESHSADDECGAPEFFSNGAKLVGLPGHGSKLDPATVAAQLARMPAGALKQVQPAVLSITNVTESGVVYRPDEVRALKAAIAPRGLKLHLDGARFPHAVAALGLSPAELTWKAGVDILSFGGTKVGAIMAEAVVVFDPALARELPWRQKRGGHVLSKNRFAAAQFEALLADGYWLELARHANAMAARLAEGLTRVPGIRLAWPCEANEVFPIVPADAARRWRAAGLTAHDWGSTALPPSGAPREGETMLRLVCSFATTAEQVDGLLAMAAKDNA